MLSVRDDWLILDFDGVLFDSVDECFNSCVEAGFIGHNELAKEKFELNRWMVGDPGEYKILCDFIGSKRSLSCSKLSRETFQREVERLSTLELKDRRDCFFEARAKLKKRIGLDAWANLHIPTTFFHQLNAMGLADKCKTFILSTKDEESIRLLLDKYACAQVPIFGSNAVVCAGGKQEFLKSFFKLNDVGQGAVFIDDNQSYFDGLEAVPQLTCILAGWGYNAVADNTSTVLAYLRENLD